MCINIKSIWHRHTTNSVCSYKWFGIAKACACVLHASGHCIHDVGNGVNGAENCQYIQHTFPQKKNTCVILLRERRESFFVWPCYDDDGPTTSHIMCAHTHFQPPIWLYSWISECVTTKWKGRNTLCCMLWMMVEWRSLNIHM